MRLIKIFLMILIISFSSCNKTTEAFIVADIPEIYINKSELKLVAIKGQWFYNNSPFNGFAIIEDENNIILEKTGYLNGKREGVYKKWFSNEQLQKEAYYKQNKLVGVTKIWWANNNLASEFHYLDGIKHGTQKMWYPNGQLSKMRNLNMGKEEGMQQAWLENGKIYVNYEAKNGRIFGMNRANLCYKLKEENIQYAKN